MHILNLTIKKSTSSTLFWIVESSDNPDLIPPGLLLSSPETAKSTFLFDPDVTLGPPWINKELELWLSNYDTETPASRLFVKGRLYIERIKLNVIEEIPIVVIVHDIISKNKICLKIEFERRNNLIQASLHKEVKTALTEAKFNDKLKELLETIENVKERQLDLEARVLSIERDEYVENKNYGFINLLLKDNLQGAVVLLVILLCFNAIFVEDRRIEDIFRNILGVPPETTPGGGPTPGPDKLPGTGPKPQAEPRAEPPAKPPEAGRDTTH